MVNPALDAAHAPVLAEIMGLTVERTGCVVTVKPALFCPAGTVTTEGTPAEAEELDRLTGCPPCGAGVFRATFPFTVFPPMTSDLDNVTDPTHAGAAEGLMVRVAVAVLAEDALIVAVV
jgi:hypothetical protein